MTPNDPGDGDSGPNQLQNFPGIATEQVVTGASTTVAGTLNSLASTTFALDFFANPSSPDSLGFWQARRYLGSTSVTTNGSGGASFNVLLSAATSAGEVITVTATDPSGNTSEIGGQLPVLTPPNSPTAVEGAFSLVSLGSFSDLDGSPWTVDVNWGDSSPDTIFSTASTGALSQNHTYVEEGPEIVKVKVTDSSGLSRTMSLTVVVADAALTAGAASATGGVEGVSATSLSASFSDADSGASASDFTVTIAWGDGSTDTTGASGSRGSYTVSASHTYAEEGGYPISILVADDGGSTTSMSATATVSDAALTAGTASAVGGVENLTNPVNGIIADGQGVGTIQDNDEDDHLEVLVDTVLESDETFSVNLSNAVNAVIGHA